MNKFCSGLMLLAGLCHTAAADVVVQWGGTAYVTNTQLLEGYTGASVDPDGPFAISGGLIAGRALSLDTPFSPSSGYDNSQSSAIFYGGTAVTNTLVTNDGLSEATVLNQGSGNSLHFRVDSGNDVHTMHVLTYWDKANFLNGLNAVPNLTFDAAGQFSLTTGQVSGGQNQNDLLLRWVVRNGTQFYVSQWAAALTPNDPFTGVYSALTNWALYNPVDPAGVPNAADLQSLDFDESGPFNVLSSTFTNITGLGFYVEHESATQSVNFHVESFQASAAAVPEPSSVGLGLVGLAGFAVRRYRSRRTAERSAES